MAAIRPATIADLSAINDIYNHYVLHSTCTYQTVPSTAQEREEWFAAHGPKHPVIVVEENGVVLGMGFEKLSHLKEVGFKQGRWLDVIWMQKML